MLRLIVLAVVVVAAYGGLLGGKEDFQLHGKFDSAFIEDFETYKSFHGKFYTDYENEFRRRVFEANKEVIRAHNAKAAAGVYTYTLGTNKFADWTNKEFVTFMNGFSQDKSSAKPVDVHRAVKDDLPTTVDWRSEGYVTPVKNQKQCGSCWSFSATGALEGQHFKKTGMLVSLSEQNLVDCSRPEGNMGCQGGLMDQAFEYIKINDGVDTEMSYPYTAMNGQCHFTRENVGATDTGFMDIARMDEMALKDAVATVGPISVAIDASKQSFQLYQNGVYSDPECSSTVLDHGVLAVGYGTDNGMDYWLVKNSWGMTWGMEGYIKMARNMNNMCGIATSASYPLV